MPACQSCGETEINTSSAICPSCGGNLASITFSEGAQKLHSELMSIPDAQRASYIRSFPLPTEKDDIIAMLSLAVPLSVAHENHSDLSTAELILDSLGVLANQRRDQLRIEASAWATKADAIIQNAMVLYNRDPSFVDVLNRFQDRLNNQSRRKKERLKSLLILLPPLCLVVTVVANPLVFLALPKSLMIGDEPLGEILRNVFENVRPVIVGTLLVFLAWLGYQVVAQKRKRTQSKQNESSRTDNPAATVPIATQSPSGSISSQEAPQSLRSSKSKSVALLLCFFLGFYGIHRFYVGKIGTGLLMFFTFGGFGFVWLFDLVMLATSNFKDKRGYRIA